MEGERERERGGGEMGALGGPAGPRRPGGTSGGGGGGADVGNEDGAVSTPTRAFADRRQRRGQGEEEEATGTMV
jgi:hypothetical protein